MKKFLGLLASTDLCASLGRGLAVSLVVFCVSCMEQRRDIRYSFGRCSVSSDGSTVLFNALDGPYLAPGVACDIYSIKDDGSGLTQLTSGPVVRYSPWFSPDDRSIVYISASSAEPGCHVCVMDRGGRSQRQLTFGDQVDGDPSYSRDGSKIVFARAALHRQMHWGGMSWNDWDIWLMNADGSSIRQLTFERYYDVDAPYFSPDGKHVLFAATASTGRGDKFKSWHPLLMFDLLNDGSAANLREIPLPPPPKDGDYDGQPSYSPDGSTIVFTSLRVSPDSPFDYEIWMADADGGNLRQITHARTQIQDPIHSSDGKFIYYWRASYGGWRMAPDGSNPQTVVPPEWRVIPAGR